MKAILSVSLSALFLIAPAMLLRADDSASLLDAARKAVAKNDIPGASEKFDKALAATAPADKRYAAIAIEYAQVLKKVKANERALVIVKAGAEKQKSAGVPAIDRIAMLNALAEAEVALLDKPAFEATEEELVKTWTEAVGPNEPVVANNLVRLAQTYMLNAKYADAAKAAARAVEILKKSHGADSPAAGYAMSIEAQAQGRSGQGAAAVETAKAARAIMDKTLDPKARPAVGGITAPKIVKKVEPEYTEAARKAKIQGSITLSLTVDETGSATNVIVLLPLGAGLDEKAMAAVKSWKFEPGLKNDEPVAVRSVVEVNLRLL